MPCSKSCKVGSIISFVVETIFNMYPGLHGSEKLHLLNSLHLKYHQSYRCLLEYLSGDNEL